MMYICLNGQLGSGKSEVCRRLKGNYGYSVFSTGSIQRAFAQELGISTLELNALCATDRKYDDIIDGRLVEYANAHKGENIVFDSRMAWHFVTDSFKVYLLVSPMVAAKRVFNNRVSKEETYESLNEAMEELVERHRLENERYLELYNANVTDFSNYDLVIDTSDITPDEVVALLMDGIAKKANGIPYKYAYVAPRNIYPTKVLSQLSEEYLSDYEQKIEKKIDLPPVILMKVKKELFVYSGNHRTLAALLAKERLIKAEIRYYENDVLPNGKRVKDIAVFSKQNLLDWEERGAFRYYYYPIK